MDLEVKLVERCLKDRESGLSAAVLKDLKSDNSVYSLLAIFQYDMQEGGFPQFVYNANGVYLPEMADVLRHVGASQTNAYLDKVISLCVDKNEDYQEFLVGAFEDTPFKAELQALSQQYSDSEHSLQSEAGEKIAKLIKRAERS